MINKSKNLDQLQNILMFHLKILDSIAIIVFIVDVQDPVIVVIQVVHVVTESIFIKIWAKHGLHAYFRISRVW